MTHIIYHERRFPMATSDKVLLMHKVEGTLRTRMFANLLDEAVTEIQDHLDEFDIVHVANEDNSETDDLLNTFIAAKASSGRSEKTLIRYQYLIERFMQFAGVKTRDVTTECIRQYFAHEAERGVSESTIEGIRQAMSSYFGWLEHEKLIHSNPVFNVEPIKYEKKVRESFSAIDLERIKRTCNNIRDIAIINFLLATACRISEVTGLNRSDIDFESLEVTVLGKGKKQRTVYINEVAALTLREYLATRTDDNEALFINKFGKRFENGGIREMLRKISAESGVDKIHPHRFRRTTITTLLNHGMPIQDVAILAGHDKIDTTMRYYSASKSRIKSSYQRFIQ